MTSHKTANKRREMFKSKGSNWKDVVRAQKLRRLEAARSNRIDKARKSVMQNIQLEEDLQLEQDLLGEELEQEYNHLFNEPDEVECPCPICGQELGSIDEVRPVECKTCDFYTRVGWDEFQQFMGKAHRQHLDRGCAHQAEIISLDGDLFIACEICDHLEAVL
ncbi:uncharacterized protein LOC100901238 isoform X2 [Galendromus occidentalis]|uniref:Uncharacterized protein LOC100901238 isoform X2 n=1 Tax=Galendromus occidentalis TaxID=34638 RepID=A0AAJ6QMZ1_9ACAR|nr:uncharacterized protein LOC100901238 isoform X2 [Galendromus occidentalis]